MNDVVHTLERVPYYAAGSEGQLTSTFNVRLPEIYQVEVTNACNFTCLRGDTLIDTMFGQIPIKVLAESCETIPVYTYKKGKVFIADAINIRKTGIKKQLVRVEFDDGTHIDCTPDHKFLQFKSRSVLGGTTEWATEAKDLVAGSRIRAFRENLTGYGPHYVVICSGRNFRKKRSILTTEYLLGRKLRAREVVHHIDHNTENDHPDNLKLSSSQKKHIKLEHPEIAERMRKNNPVHTMSSAQRAVWREKISVSNTGKIRSPEQREHYRQSRLGKKNPNYKHGQYAEANHWVVAVTPLAEQDDVYCLQVPATGWFYANKVLVKNCDFCPRDLPDIRRPDTFLDLDLARLIAERDLGGSYFVEFQLAGEPTLHKQLPEIIECFKGKVLTGLSTNGSSVHGNNVWRGLLMLDYLTISVDSVEQYETVRPGGKWDKLVSNIDFLLEKRAALNGPGNKSPAIDLQLIEFPGVERQRDLLVELAARRGWDVSVRRIPDCFISMTREFKKVKRKELCLNPWMSVSVQSDGDVTSCCFTFGKDIVYGNLRNQSLEEIWTTSPELEKFRQEHRTGNLRSICDACYQRSPVLLHWDLYQGAVKERVLNESAR